ncbi:MAG: hypothetical protein HOV81_10860 [Kofleriaceae bacterium]|nr:hypothetical protein [Kofleriaceae bacterium]
MIGPGSMPRFPWRAFRRKATLPYTRRRRSRPRIQNQAASSPAVEIVAFDHGPAEFPMASVRPREARGRAVAVLGDLQRWLAARWAWFKPRSVPCAVAGLGMLAVIASADYLAHHMDQGDTHKPTVVRIDLGPR